jgi:hypothetical protein
MGFFSGYNGKMNLVMVIVTEADSIHPLFLASRKTVACPVKFGSGIKVGLRTNLLLNVPAVSGTTLQSNDVKLETFPVRDMGNSGLLHVVTVFGVKLTTGLETNSNVLEKEADVVSQ